MWRTIERGVVSAARMTSSAVPRLRALVVSLAPFLSCLKWPHCCTRSRSSRERAASALGQAAESLASDMVIEVAEVGDWKSESRYDYKGSLRWLALVVI